MHGLRTGLGKVNDRIRATSQSMAGIRHHKASGASGDCEASGNGQIDLRNAQAGDKNQRPWPKCAPKCAPKVHGAVRAAAYRWQSTGMTLAFGGKKRVFLKECDMKKAGWTPL
jgi:hypothetical protein